MIREDAGDLSGGVVAHGVGEVLLDRAAERHVQHLEAAADAQQRDVALERPVCQRELEPIALGPGPVGLGVRPGP